MSRLHFTLGLCFLSVSLAGATGPSLTIYNQDFAVVGDTVPLDLHEGVNQIHFADLTAQVEPNSVVLRDRSGKNEFRVLEQNYRADFVTQALMLSRFEGQTIDFLVQQPQKSDAIIAGKIIRSGDERRGETQPIVEVAGKLRFDLPGKPLFPKLADESILQPELVWKISSERPAKFDAEITYLTGAMNWSADYNVIMPESGDILQIAGWVTINNKSGKSFENARTKLVAGDVSKIKPAEGAKSYDTTERVMVTASNSPVPEKSFDEYHLYTLPLPVTLRDRESKQIEFIRSEGVHSTRFYVFDATGYETPGWVQGEPIFDEAWGVGVETKLGIVREFKNSEENHLGLPLPKGRWRFYRRDTDQQLEFTGEHEEDHTGKDETLRIFTGTAFDLVAERRQTDFTIDRSKHTMDEAFEIKLRNHKNEAVEIRVIEHLNRWRSWEIVEHSDAFTRKNAHAIEFVVRLKPAEEKSVSYRARYTQLPAL